MEIRNAQDAIESILKNHSIEAYFTSEELRQVAQDMVVAMKEVLGELGIEYVSFHDDDDMFFNLDKNFVHLGLGIVKKMLDTWFANLTGGGSVYMPKEIIKEEIVKSLIGDAAHEAGHRVVDLHPIKELGFSREEWGRLGVQYLANALMDCRNDDRIMKLHADLKPVMQSALEFSFGPGGRLDWPSEKADMLLKKGHPALFGEFDSEAIRLWAYGKIDDNADDRVRKLLEAKHGEIEYIAKNQRCVPGEKPGALERKAKAIEAYKKIIEIFNGDYQKLLSRDIENQSIHQAISIVALVLNNHAMNEKLSGMVKDEIGKLDGTLKQELESKLEEQREEKEKYEQQKKPVEKIITAAQKKTDVVTNEAPAPQEEPQDYFDLLGPAVLVEDLSPDLREFLLKLFQKMQQNMQNQMLSALLKQLLENPEKFLKWLEDKLSDKIKPHTIPGTSPNHADLENEPAQAKPMEKPYELDIGGSSSVMDYAEFPTTTPRELEKVEKWLQENIDIKERIDAWRKAIYSTLRTRRRKTDRPSSYIDFPALVQDEIMQEMGLEPGGKIFLEKRPKREKITFSILWRTIGVSAEEALKLFVFLMKIYEDSEINRYLDLEILVSQKVPGVRTSEDAVPIPIVIGFDQHPIRNFEQIMGSLLALQKSAATGGALSIVQDATALRIQRERLLRKNPGSKKRFLIDLWDEAAIEAGAADPMAAVKEEIIKTQQALKGRAFCFVLKNNASAESTPARTYGTDQFLLCKSIKALIEYLDIVVRDMIKYQDKYATHIRQDVERELGVVIPEYT